MVLNMDEIQRLKISLTGVALMQNQSSKFLGNMKTLKFIILFFQMSCEMCTEEQTDQNIEQKSQPSPQFNLKNVKKRKISICFDGDEIKNVLKSSNFY